MRSDASAEGVELSDLQHFFIELCQSSDGWYLIPQWNFMDMAEFSMLACVVALVFLVGMTGTWILRDFVHKGGKAA